MRFAYYAVTDNAPGMQQVGLRLFRLELGDLVKDIPELDAEATWMSATGSMAEVLSAGPIVAPHVTTDCSRHHAEGELFGRFNPKGDQYEVMFCRVGNSHGLYGLEKGNEEVLSGRFHLFAPDPVVPYFLPGRYSISFTPGGLAFMSLVGKYQDLGSMQSYLEGKGLRPDPASLSTAFDALTLIKTGTNSNHY